MISGNDKIIECVLDVELLLLDGDVEIGIKFFGMKKEETLNHQKWLSK